MEALTTLSTKIFAANINKTPSLSTSTQLVRSDFAFSPSPTFKKLQFDHLVSFRCIAKSHVASDTAEVSTGLGNAVPDFPKTQRSKTTHVKFQLQKKCMFGDRFLLVGDDPILGMWDPLSAVPMKWSDGHIWSVELDVPIESTIQFKFILRQRTGDVFWQPGPDRIFKSWESKGTVVIAEDWENPEAQKITEEQVTNHIEEQVINQMEELMPNMNNCVMFSGNTAYEEGKLNVGSEFFTIKGATNPVEGHLNNSNKILKSEDPVEDINEDATKKNNSRALTGNNPMAVGDEDHRLVPGLTPMQVVSGEEALPRELGSIIDNASFGVDSAMD